LRCERRRRKQEGRCCEKSFHRESPFGISGIGWIDSFMNSARMSDGVRVHSSIDFQERKWD
jgi:hypothetical protein